MLKLFMTAGQEKRRVQVACMMWDVGQLRLDIFALELLLFCHSRFK